MKTNLKNKPDLEELKYKIPGTYKVVTSWFNNFEKELLERKKFEEKQTKNKNKSQQLVAHFQIDLINKILGENNNAQPSS